MAIFNIPNLCGASPELNASLDEINKLKEKLLSNIDADPSDLKADLESGLADLKGAFDKLEIELPEIPNVNFQAEVTSLINDIDKTTVEGFAAFNIKLASLKLDFEETLSDKGIDFDSLIASSEAKLDAIPYSFSVRVLTNVFLSAPFTIRGKLSGAISPLALNLGTIPLEKSSVKVKHGERLISSCLIFNSALSFCCNEDSLTPPQENISTISATPAGAI